MRYKKNAITFITPSHNGSTRIEECLRSIRKQTYLQNLIDIIVVDDSSTDNTSKLAKKYGARVYTKNFGDAQMAKKFGLGKVQTEFFINADDDHRLVSDDWIEQMIFPLREDKKINASFTKFTVHASDPPISRLLSFDPLQRDPIYMPFTPHLSEITVEKRERYDVLRYIPGKIPPTGQCVWRTELFDHAFIYERKKYMELDILSLLVRNGYDLFAYVPSAKTHHVIAGSIQTICRKRIRNIRKNYLFQTDPREFIWFDITNPRDVVKVVLWILYVETFLLPFIYGVYLSLKHSDRAGLWYAPLAWTETNVILFEFFRQFTRAVFGKNIVFPAKT